jgi:integrase
MRTSKTTFTDDVVKTFTCPPGEAEKLYWDAKLAGFGCRAYPTGRRQWIVQYRDQLGRTRRSRVGDAGNVGLANDGQPRPKKASKQARKPADNTPTPVVPLAAARAAAAQLLAKVMLGADPQAEKEAARKAIRVGVLVTNYLAEAETRLRPRSYSECKRHLMTHAKPIHDDPAGTLGRAGITALLKAIANKNGPIAANRVRASLSAMWTWALKSGLIEGDNVVTYTIKPGVEKQRERVLTDAELALIWHATAGEHDHNSIVRLLLLTGCRRDEVANMAWSEINGSMWTLPRSRSKNHMPHEVALGPLALAQLPAKRGERDLVFGDGEGGYSGLSQGKARLDARILKARVDAFREAHGRAPADGELQPMPWVLHDLRRTLSTWLSENDVEPHIVEAVLNHTSGAAKRGVAGVYNKATYRGPKRAALVKWEAHIRALAGLPAGETQDGNVVVLARTG